MARKMPEHLFDQAEIRKQILARFAGIFERQVRARLYAQSVNELVQTTHSEVMDLLMRTAVEIDTAALQHQQKNRIAGKLSAAVERFTRLGLTLDLLLSDQLQQWQSTQVGLRQVMSETNATAKQLASTLVEKTLFERHAQILESIVLSHEKITLWDRHLKDILSEFHSIIPASLFFVAFEDGGTSSLYLFYLEHCDADIRTSLRAQVLGDLQASMNFSASINCDVHEHALDCDDLRTFAPTQDPLQFIGAPISRLDGSLLNGRLGVAHTRGERISPQELSVIRSVVSVMVMVVSSSKALGHTLKELEFHSLHDPLTGLHNRRSFNEMLQSEQARAQRHTHEFSVLMIDLDDFKDINDTYGHPCGDEVLQKVAEVIRLPMRFGDHPTRIGGDEFAVILTETGAAGARIVAEKLRNQIRELVFSCEDSGQFRITASIGVITYPDDAQSLSDLIAGADQSLYRAKRQGKDSVISLDSVQNVLVSSRLTRSYAEQLRHSLMEGRVLPHYQPIVDCQSGALFAYEALARTIEPDGTIVSAGAFIETAEKYGLIRDFDRVIIRRAFADLAEHIRVHGVTFQLFINLSAQEIQSRGVLNYAEQLCMEMGLPLSTVVFEITERDAISDMAHMRTFLEDLRRKGFLFALDDFGSGYNSFHYLRELSFDYVKIDGAFVRNIVDSKADQILVRNLCRLCGDLGILTIAEFVESQKILDVLQGVGVNYVQGYHLGRPRAHFNRI